MVGDSSCARLTENPRIAGPFGPKSEPNSHDNTQIEGIRAYNPDRPVQIKPLSEASTWLSIKPGEISESGP